MRENGLPPVQEQEARKEASAAARETTPGAARRWLRWLHRRWLPPTSVIVTLLVAAFSVWVGPAFTRQWEDRKQARELQATLAEEISLAASRLANTIDTINGERSTFSGRDGDLYSALEQWQLEHTRVATRLRVYFSSELRTLWTDFYSAIDDATFVIEAPTSPQLERLKLLRDLERTLGSESSLATYVPEKPAPRQTPPIAAVSSIPSSIRDIADAIVERLMAANPEAFSTTRGDLFRDIIP